MDCGKTGRGSLSNMCVIVFFPPFPRCERECRVALGCPRERRLKRQSQLPHRAPARSKSQARPSWAEGPRLGPGAAGVPQAFSSYSSHQHKGDRDHAGSLLRKGWAKTWQNGLTEACIHTKTHTQTLRLSGLSVLPVGMMGKKEMK